MTSDLQPCLLQSDRDGRITILSCPDVAPVSREIIERQVALHNAVVDLKLAKGHHNTRIAAEALFSLIP